MTTDPDLDRMVEAAYAMHRAPLVRRLTALTRDASTAEDLTQEAFVRLVVELRAGRCPENIGAWLHRVGQNLAMSRGRRLTVADRRRRDLLPVGDVPSPETATLAAEEQRVVWSALSTLDATDRRALVLAAHGFSGLEIAASIGRSDGATRTLLCRARAKVRQHVRAFEPQGGMA